MNQLFLTSQITEVLVTELEKISDQLVTFCIVIAIALVVLGLIVSAIKSAFRAIFKRKK